MVAWRFEISLLVLKNPSLDRWLTREVLFNTQRKIFFISAWPSSHAISSMTVCNDDRIVTMISSCWVNTTSRRVIKQQGISIGSIFLLFSYESSWGPRS